jgi:hypothetical protein
MIVCDVPDLQSNQSYIQSYIVGVDRAVTAWQDCNTDKVLEMLLSSVSSDSWWQHSSSGQNDLQDVIASPVTISEFEVTSSQNNDAKDLPVQNKLEVLTATLHSYAQLPNDWDGYGGYPASWRAIADTEEFLKKLANETHLPRPMLSGDGTVGLFWEKKDIYVSLDFMGDGVYTFLIDRDGDYQGQDDVPVSGLLPDSLRVALEQITNRA